MVFRVRMVAQYSVASLGGGGGRLQHMYIIYNFIYIIYACETFLDEKGYFVS